jgi:membrane protein implicated in regulation of membrane protease activity
MALLKYTLLRLALLAVTAGVFYLVGLRDWVLLFAAFLVSGIISIFVLNRARNEVSTSIASRQQRINQRMESGEDETDGQSDREP